MDCTVGLAGLCLPAAERLSQRQQPDHASNAVHPKYQCAFIAQQLFIQQ